MRKGNVPSFQTANGIRDKMDYAVIITVIGDSATYKVFGMDSRRIGEIERVVELLKGVADGIQDPSSALPATKRGGCWSTLST
jgi:hypothetical protein